MTNTSTPKYIIWSGGGHAAYALTNTEGRVTLAQLQAHCPGVDFELLPAIAWPESRARQVQSYCDLSCDFVVAEDGTWFDRLGWAIMRRLP